VPGHKEIAGNETAKLARQGGLNTLFIWCEPACSISDEGIKGLQGTGGVEST